MIIMPHQEGWIGQPLSTSRAFDDYAETLEGVARGRDFPIEKIRLQQEYALSLLLWENLGKTRGPNNLGQAFENHFGFIESEDPDAFVQCRDGIHYCGINTGLVRSAFYLADEIFLLRNLIPGFGGYVDKDGADWDLELTPDLEWMAESEARAAVALAKAHPKRVAARDHFAHFLVTFTMYHEFNHAISGHSIFVASRTGLGRLHEFGSTAADGLSSPLHQEIEYTADIGAIETMFDYVHRGAILRRLYRNAPRTPVLHRIFLVALSVLCALWNRMNQTFGADGFHPEPAARWATSLRLYTLFLQSHYAFGRWILIGRSAVKDMSRIAMQCEDVLDLMTGLAAYGEGSEYWTLRDPENHAVKPDDIRDLCYPPLIKPKPYRNKQLEAMISRAI